MMVIECDTFMRVFDDSLCTKWCAPAAAAIEDCRHTMPVMLLSTYAMSFISLIQCTVHHDMYELFYDVKRLEVCASGCVCEWREIIAPIRARDRHQIEN